jgi:glycosyltransferase involved in cell wall biosynthesis
MNRQAGCERRRRRDIAFLQVVAGLDPAAGGPPVCAVATALALVGEDCKNALVFPLERGREHAAEELLAIVRAGGSDVRTFGEPRVFGAYGRRWGVSPSLAFWLLRRTRAFDVVHAHSAWTFTTLVGLLAAKIHGRAAVLSSHESLTDFDQRKSRPVRRGIKRALRWLYLRAFDVVVVASTLEQADMGKGGVRSVVVPHGVVGFSPSANEPSANGELRVGFLGRLDRKKNLEVLIDALARLPERVSLHVAGDGPLEYRRTLVSRAVNNGVEERIHWRGFVDNRTKPEFFASIDVLAMPSSFECFGVAAVEALSARVPVLVSPRVGIADVVKEHDCGCVVDTSATEIARALKRMLEDPERRLRQSASAPVVARREFSIATYGQRIRAAYERALSQQWSDHG